jgi:hypothetical protein
MLHLDIWFNGENILRDNGTYLYNSSDTLRNYFFGSRSHNTLLYDGKDLMKKGERFIFYYWPEKVSGNVKIEQDSFIFEGKINIFPSPGSKVFITRKVIKKKDKAEWKITDTLTNSSKRSWTQNWNISDSFLLKFNMFVIDENDDVVEPVITNSYTSPEYGIKTDAKQLQFSTFTNILTTTITQK